MFKYVSGQPFQIFPCALYRDRLAKAQVEWAEIGVISWLWLSSFMDKISQLEHQLQALIALSKDPVFLDCHGFVCDFVAPQILDCQRHLVWCHCVLQGKCGGAFGTLGWDRILSCGLMYVQTLQAVLAAACFIAVAARPQEPEVTITQDVREINGDGSFNVLSETSDGTRVEQKGYIKNPEAPSDEQIQVLEGSFSFRADDGKKLSIQSSQFKHSMVICVENVEIQSIPLALCVAKNA